MNQIRQRPLPLDQLRAFEAVARCLSFRQAAEEMHLTQSAISRQIKALEDELGASLFDRGTRHVQLTGDGSTLLRAVAPWLDRLDASVRQIRQARGRRGVSVTTFASFASLWLIPQMEAFQREHPDVDMRVSATDSLVDPDGNDTDVALRHCTPDTAPPRAVRLFGEVLTPVISRVLAQQVADGSAPPLRTPADLAQHTLAEEDHRRTGGEFLSWNHWLREQGVPSFQPRRWLYLNYTYQQVQAALGGQGVALARAALVTDALQRGDLVEPFGVAGRLTSPYAYWLIVGKAAAGRAEVRQFCEWVQACAAHTRQAIGELAAQAGRPA